MELNEVIIYVAAYAPIGRDIAKVRAENHDCYYRTLESSPAFGRSGSAFTESDSLSHDKSKVIRYVLKHNRKVLNNLLDDLGGLVARIKAVEAEGGL